MFSPAVYLLLKRTSDGGAGGAGAAAAGAAGFFVAGAAFTGGFWVLGAGLAPCAAAMDENASALLAIRIERRTPVVIAASTGEEARTLYTVRSCPAYLKRIPRVDRTSRAVALEFRP